MKVVRKENEKEGNERKKAQEIRASERSIHKWIKIREI